MRRVVFATSIGLVLLLSYAALDDITTGSDEDYFLEYTFLLISISLFILPGIYLLLNRKEKKFSKGSN